MMPLTTCIGELDEGMDILERAITEEYGTRTVETPKPATAQPKRMLEAA
jgi:hypothetical protein